MTYGHDAYHDVERNRRIPTQLHQPRSFKFPQRLFRKKTIVAKASFSGQLVCFATFAGVLRIIGHSIFSTSRQIGLSRISFESTCTTNTNGAKPWPDSSVFSEAFCIVEPSYSSKCETVNDSVSAVTVCCRCRGEQAGTIVAVAAMSCKNA